LAGDTAADTTEETIEPTVESELDATGDSPAADDTVAESDDASATAGDEPSESVEAPPSYKPLEEVQDEIRRKLALPRAQQILADRMESARAAMESYFRKHVVWKSKPADSDRGPEPERPDFQQLAAEYGFTSGKTSLLDPVQFLEHHDIGKSSYWDPNSFARGSFAQIAFNPSLLQFMARETRLENVTTDTEKRFLWWKLEDQEAHVPELDDVRDDVVKAWKLIEALDEANAEAESIAKRLNENGQTLQDAYGTVLGKEIIKTDPFSWMTGLDLPSMNYSNVFPSRIDGVEGVTNDFLRDIFALAPQSAGWVVNGDHSIVYVVQIFSQSPDENELRDGFIVTGVNGHMQRIFQESRGQLLQAWYQGVEDQLSLVWLEDPRIETR
jgi:predicted DsbA family dithiol-disulfide isomerase